MIWHMVHVHLSYYEAENDLKSKMCFNDTDKNGDKFRIHVLHYNHYKIYGKDINIW